MLQRQGIFLDETSVVSNLTSATSNDATTNNRNEVIVGTTNSTHQLLQVPNHQNFMSSTGEEDLITHHQPPSKKKRSLPGNPDPDADVVALSPKSLMATNRFVCEICNKGFPRDQNLQLHRRGHNLPWKLKQRNKNEVVKRKVYICPETSCVHHDPSRALGDLTGIKKHFSRKHGEKKYKCDKCSKRYAVQSDWKAHSKICGTREYRCDCGTLFSRRDSFITHRAFCDALAEESSSRSMTHPNNNPHHHHHILHNVQRAHNNLNHHQHLPPWLLSSEPAAGVSAQNPQILNPFVTTASASLMLRNQSMVSENPNIHIPNNENSIIFPTTINSTCAPPSSLTSATALLQKAAQMGVTMCTDTPHQTSDVDRSSSSYHHHVDGLFAATSSYSSNITAGFMPSREGCWHAGLASLENKQVSDRVTGGVCMETNNTVVVGGMNSSSSSFAFDHQNNFNPAAEKKNDGFRGNEGQRLAGNDKELTRDFLGLRAFPDGNKDQFISMSGLHQMGSSSYDHRQTRDDHQLPWQQISQ